MERATSPRQISILVEDLGCGIVILTRQEFGGEAFCVILKDQIKRERFVWDDEGVARLGI